MQAGPTLARDRAAPAAPRRAPVLQTRFAAIWVALLVLLIVGRIGLPRSVEPSTILAILPFAAFLTMAAMGQALVMMGRGIDLSVPAIISLTSTVLLGVSGGSNDRMWLAMGVALLAALVVGLINGLLIALLRLNALIVTLAVGAIVQGVTLWYRQGLAAEAKVPEALANFGSAWYLGVPAPAWVAFVMLVVLTILLRKSVIGRRFELVGANPEAAHASGIEIRRYQAGAFIIAALLYGILSIMLSGFIRNPTFEVGNPYLLAPIAAAVLGGTAINGGIGSMIAVTGAALFLTQLDQALKMLGVPTSWQMIIQGLAIATGMWLSEVSARLARRRRR